MAGGILGQCQDCTPIYSPGGPEVVHDLSYGRSELYGDRLRGWAEFTELSQAQATIFEDDHEPLATWKHGEEVDGLFDLELGDLSGRGVMVTPETVKARLAD
jgi:hypothetical protein